MSRLRRVLQAVSWKYAVGELTLLVTGILLALAINGWNDDRRARRDELGMLRELQASLKADLMRLDSAIIRLELHNHGLTRSLAQLSGMPVPPDSLGPYFGLAYWQAGQPILSTAAYEVLRARGVDRISADSLRVHIVRLYDEQYVRVERRMETDRLTVQDVMRPYFLQHYRDLRFGVNATPIDLGVLMRDPLIRNILEYRQFNVVTQTMPAYQQARKSIMSLVTEIEAEVDP